MEKVPFTNQLSHCVHVGSTLVRPNETRMVDPSLLTLAPCEPSTKPQAPPPTDIVMGLLDASIATVKTNLPELSAAQLDALEQGEADGKTRKGVIEAIAAERLRRASPAE